MMKKIGQLQKDNQGFTLVELMIVVAIIGILAAIAIPQFAAYRIRGFNSSALADIRNVATSEAAFSADWQIFGVSDQIANANAGAGAGALIVGGDGNDDDGIMADDASGTNRTTPLGISNGVSVVASADGTSSSYTSISKHTQGDTYFAMDSDAALVYQEVLPANVGVALAAGDEIAPVAANDDYTGQNGPGGTAYIVK